jgi:hypothetical protein
MPNDKDWFIRERGEALAALLLTSRDDVHVRRQKERTDGVDLLVEVDRGEPLSRGLFVVQVKGTLSADQREWMKSVKQLFQVNPKGVYLPTCVFVVNVRDNRAQYAWVAEPLIQDQGAKLQLLPPGDFHELNPSAVDEIINRVKAWYEVLPKQLAPN